MAIAERFLTSAFLASGVTFGLFWLMQALVAIDEGVILVHSSRPTVDFVYVEQPEREVVRRPIKPVRDDPDEEPPPPKFTTPNTRNGESGIIPGDPIKQDGPLIHRNLFSNAAGSDASAIALVRIAPNYPERALRKGIEGRVLVEFTISRTGAVKNPRILAAEPSSIFNAAALKAIEQWRYNPKIENGFAVEQKGIRIAIPFRQSESGS